MGTFEDKYWAWRETAYAYAKQCYRIDAHEQTALADDAMLKLRGCEYWSRPLLRRAVKQQYATRLAYSRRQRRGGGDVQFVTLDREDMAVASSLDAVVLLREIAESSTTSDIKRRLRAALMP